MTEQEWLAATDPKLMLEFVRGKDSERQLRLFAVACCRSIWHLMTEEIWRKGVEMAEQYADGNVSKNKMRSLWIRIEHTGTVRTAQFPFFEFRPSHAVVPAMSFDIRFQVGVVSTVISFLADVPVNQSHLLREIFANPFRPVMAHPVWLTTTVLALAKGIYADRAFDRLPILADALQDAGCDNEDVLNHCRSKGPHVRGCWVIDRVLNKQ